MRIERFLLLRNIGHFVSVDAGRNLPLKKLTLIYGENGRGKTTLAEILRSAATNDTALMTARQRLGSDHPVHVVLATDTGNLSFQNGCWSPSSPHFAVFDDHFIAANVCSGIEVDGSHREGLHELILGAQGVALVDAIDRHAQHIEDHNRLLRQKAEAIPAAVRGALSLEDFCALPAVANVDGAIAAQQQLLAAARSFARVRTEPVFSPIELPAFDVVEITTLLARTLSDLDAQVIAHLRDLGSGGESWVGGGLGRVSQREGHDVCPFCTQDIADASLLDHYRAFFGGAYEALKKTIGEYGKQVDVQHRDGLRDDLEHLLRAEERRVQFWGAFVSLPLLDFEISAFLSVWLRAREAVLSVLRWKYAAPLEPLELSRETVALLEDYEKRRSTLMRQLQDLQGFNAAIVRLKGQSESADLVTVEAQLGRLQVARVRHSEPAAAACRAYLAELAAKAVTDRAKAEARQALDAYRGSVLPRYSAAINDYLGQLNAGFRLGEISSVNHRGGASCRYAVLINDVTVNLTAETGPSFRNTLSAGDRNTLALAFFFASLDEDSQLAQKVVVLDDPMTSLDEHRSRNTVHVVRALKSRVSQVIALSHSKPFLHELWTRADEPDCSALIIQRAADGSTLAAWDVRAGFSTEHDHRHGLVSEYVAACDPNRAREVAQALRPMLESFLRVAYPGDFRAGELLGPFCAKCQQQLGRADEILNAPDLSELQKLIDYGNRFHHETNPAFATAALNDQELADYCKRVLSFTRRRR